MTLKTFLMCFLFIFILLCNSIHSSFLPDTQFFNTNKEIDDIGWFTSLKIDDEGNPHISYYDYTNGDLKYCILNQNKWHIQLIDENGDVGRYNCLAIDSQNNPHISYYDVTNGDLKYAFFKQGSWHIEKIDSIGDVGLYTSLVLDDDDHPHISYCHYDLRALKYAYYDGSKWEITVVDNSAVICSERYFSDTTSIVLDSEDNPHISYCNIEHFILKHAWKDGALWKKETVDADGTVGVYSSIAIDNTDNVHICYADLTRNVFDLKYALKKNDSWHIEVIDHDGDIRKWIALILDNDEKPCVSFYDYSKGSLEYRYLRTNQWVKETVESDGSTGCFNDLFLIDDDFACISYYDWGEKSLKYASQNSLGWNITIIEEDTNRDYIDQKQTYCSGSAMGIEDTNPMAQSFTPEYKTITRIELMLVKRYNPGGFTLSLRDNLQGDDITSVSYSSDQIPEDISWKVFDFPDIMVSTNNTYYIVCTSEDTEEYNLYYWYFGHFDPYPNGNAWIWRHNTWDEFILSSFPDLDFGFKTFGLDTSIPLKPLIDGPQTGIVGETYFYNISSSDPDADDIYFKIQWNKDTVEKIGPYSSGDIATISHSWLTQGDHIIKVKAIDTYGAESDWSTLQVSIPKEKYSCLTPKEIIWTFFNSLLLEKLFFK